MDVQKAESGQEPQKNNEKDSRVIPSPVPLESKETMFEQETKKSSHVALEAELSMLRDVYSALRSEIRADESKLNENLNLTIAGMGAIVAIIGFVANMDQFALILALPLIFFVLILIRLETLLGLGRIGHYLSSVIYPRIRTIISELDNVEHNFGEFSIDWEDFHPRLSPPELIAVSVTASPTGLQLLFSLFPVLAYFFYKANSSQTISSLEIGLVILNLLAFIGILSIIIWSFVFGKRLRRQYRGKL